MKWSPPGRRKRGRPKLTWAEGMGDGRKWIKWKKTGMTEATGGRR